MTEIKQKQQYCYTCQRNSLHVATIKKTEMGCGTIFGNLFLCVITLGLWLPIFMLMIGVGSLGNSLAPMAARYHCQVCGSSGSISSSGSSGSSGTSALTTFVFLAIGAAMAFFFFH